MRVTSVKTDKILPKSHTLFEILDNHLPELSEGSILAITSKVVSLCEGRVVPFDAADKEELIKQDADYYLPASFSKYDYHFTISKNTLVSLAGIDESNGDGNYILWPKDPQGTANAVREYLKNKANLKKIGVVITDSTCMPLRWGTIGIALAYSGFNPLNNYVGKPDLFGRPFKVSQAGVASGIAATAVLAMGEGAEQTPIAVIEDVPFVQFQGRNPTQKELELFYISKKEDDLFAPFLNSVKWQKGGNGSK
jgi:dihydrofolate synthase / folylpolyglutamate synthase